MICKLPGTIICDECGKEVPAIIPFELGGSRQANLVMKFPEPEEGKAFNSDRGAEFLCDSCWEKR